MLGRPNYGNRVIRKVHRITSNVGGPLLPRECLASRGNQLGLTQKNHLIVWLATFPTINRLLELGLGDGSRPVVGMRALGCGQIDRRPCVVNMNSKGTPCLLVGGGGEELSIILQYYSLWAQVDHNNCYTSFLVTTAACCIPIVRLLIVACERKGINV